MLTVQSRNTGITLSEETKLKFREMVKKAKEIKSKKSVEEITQTDIVKKVYK